MDALVAITRKLGQFRGESRFTTWAYKFVILEVSDKIGRHFWRNPGVPLAAGDWDRLPDRFGFEPAREAEWRDLLAALRGLRWERPGPAVRCRCRAHGVSGLPVGAKKCVVGSAGPLDPPGLQRMRLGCAAPALLGVVSSTSWPAS